ncbi:MAG: hypothetical protein LLG04_14625 [Parachlamydia sp.]|nr:hypothetical protein [Parachlamydia sp.]
MTINSAAQTDAFEMLIEMQSGCHQKQSSLQLQLEVVNLKIQALTHRINALTDLPEVVQMDRYDQALRTANLARERLLKEQVSTKRMQDTLSEAISLRNQELQLDETIRNLMHQIAERNAKEQMLKLDIDELKALNCDIGPSTMLSGKWLLENETSTQALEVAKQKRKDLGEKILNLFGNAFELYEQSGKDPLIGGSSRAGARQLSNLPLK